MLDAVSRGLLWNDCQIAVAAAPSCDATAGRCVTEALPAAGGRKRNASAGETPCSHKQPALFMEQLMRVDSPVDDALPLYDHTFSAASCRAPPKGTPTQVSKPNHAISWHDGFSLHYILHTACAWLLSCSSAHKKAQERLAWCSRLAPTGHKGGAQPSRSDSCIVHMFAGADANSLVHG